MPSDQATALTSTATSPMDTPCPADTSGRKSNATLAAPRASPAQVKPRGLGPSFSTGSRSATIAGSMAITSAATPEGTFSSAQCRSPWLTKKKRKPRTIPARHPWRVGRSPFHHAHPSRIEPAIRCRIAAVNNGGIDSTAKRMARNVEPQIT